MTPQLQYIDTFFGGYSKRAFKVFWNPNTGQVYVEKPGIFGPELTDVGVVVAKRSSIPRVVEAYLYNK